MMFGAAFLARSATRLSWFGQGIGGGTGRFVGLARLSLGLAALSMLSGCLVDDPPPFITPQKTAPRLDYSKARPGLNQLIIRSSGDFLEFNVPVKSEDAGDPLVGNLLLDYTGKGSGGIPLGFAGVSASTLDDPNERLLKTTWKVFPKTAISAGCHLLTLRVTHFSNLVEGQSDQLIDDADLAEAYWLANINVTPEAAGTLVDCPTGSGAP